jgi:hypothetical protein
MQPHLPRDLSCLHSNDGFPVKNICFKGGNNKSGKLFQKKENNKSGKSTT